MKRVSRETLRTRIWVGLTVLKPYQKRALGLDIEHIRQAVTDDIIRRVMGNMESEAVILVPNMCGSTHSPRMGRWGEDEPYPHPDVPTDA